MFVCETKRDSEKQLSIDAYWAGCSAAQRFLKSLMMPNWRQC